MSPGVGACEKAFARENASVIGHPLMAREPTNGRPEECPVKRPGWRYDADF